jgi:hypothetical protein
MPGGVKDWVDNMPEEIISTQFPTTQPIFINDDMVERFFAQRNVREQEIEMALIMLENEEDRAVKQNIFDISFPQKFDQCTPAYGKGCPYKRICFGSVTDPLSSGFKYRVPHHAIELLEQDPNYGKSEL